jgi:hypothetical protein
LLALLAFFVLLTQRDIIEALLRSNSTHEPFVTSAPPILSPKKIPWGTTYSMLSKDDSKAHSPMLVNYFPMLKPPRDVEKTATGERIDIARPQFVPHMEKRKKKNIFL